MTVERVRHGGVVGTTLLTLLGIGWALLAMMALGTRDSFQAFLIFLAPTTLSFVAAAGWWMRRRWAPLVAIVAVIATLVVLYMLYMAYGALMALISV